MFFCSVNQLSRWQRMHWMVSFVFEAFGTGLMMFSKLHLDLLLICCHWCLFFTLWKGANDTSAEEYNGTELILFLFVTIGRPVLICPLCMTPKCNCGETLRMFHEGIDYDFYFCFAVGGLTPPLLHPSFLSCFLNRLIPYGVMGRAHVQVKEYTSGWVTSSLWGPIYII